MAKKGKKKQAANVPFQLKAGLPQRPNSSQISSGVPTPPFAPVKPSDTVNEPAGKGTSAATKKKKKKNKQKNKKQDKQEQDGTGQKNLVRFRKKKGAKHKTPATPLAATAMASSSSNPLLRHYHPDVSDSTPAEVIAKWMRTSEKYLNENRPTRAEYLDGGHGFNHGNYTYSKQLVGLLPEARTPAGNCQRNLRNVRDGTQLPCGCYAAIPRRAQQLLRGDWQFPGLQGMFHGQQVYSANFTDQLCAQGWKSLENLALAFPKGFASLQQNLTVFNVVAERFHGHPGGKSFIAVYPEYTVDDVRSDERHGMNYTKDDVAKETDLFNRIRLLRVPVGQTEPYWINEPATLTQSVLTPAELKNFGDVFGTDSVQAMRSLRYGIDRASMGARGQLQQSRGCHPYWYLQSRGILRMRNLLLALDARKQNTESLIFQKIPFLDRRLLAVILRGCPNVTMLGIYDCPLLHFGDVVAILDLIHEINEDRRAMGLAEIRAFDFYPKFHFGTPFKHDRSSTYGLSWAGFNRETVQRGFYRIILEAYLKCAQMGLGLLFNKENAFRKFLERQPESPLGVLEFLDAILRLMDLWDSEFNDNNAESMALYDMLKPVVSGLGNRQTFGRYKVSGVGQNEIFCCSCGYETYEEFFTYAELGSAPHQRTCCGCILRFWLDKGEMGCQILEKRHVLDKVFPDWASHSRDFNVAARFHRNGLHLLNLRTTETVRTPPPPMQLHPNGFIFQPPFEHEFVRDGKCVKDSMQGLPDLETICSLAYNRHWSTAEHYASQHDLHRLLSDMLRVQYPVSTMGPYAYVNARYDGGYPGHIAELQPPRGDCLDYEIARVRFRPTRAQLEENFW
ncbi:hypothetical protein G7046_g1130 [Stylonectria norvegica]|nr:hypothetical protein G7046_g1130 [Stylonectria norvegica]